MTKSEALELMGEGEKLTHTYFNKDEWVTLINDNKIKFEDGCVGSLLLFLHDRSTKGWDDGWEIYNELN